MVNDAIRGRRLMGTYAPPEEQILFWLPVGDINIILSKQNVFCCTSIQTNG